MSGIEFFSADHGDAEADEDLASGPRRPVPRWLVAFAVAVVAAGAVVVALNRGSDQPGAAPAVTPGASQPAYIPPDDNVGPPLAAGRGSRVLDVEMSGDSRWLLQPRAVRGIALMGKNRHAAVPGPPLVENDSDDVAQLALDVPAKRLWVVTTGKRYGRVLEFDAYTLRLLRDIRSAPPINSAVGFGGHLYAISGNRLLDVAPSGKLRTVVRLYAQLMQIVVDPDRNRLLMLDIGGRTRLWAVTPRAGSLPRISAPVTREITKASLAVARGAIWLGGFDTGGGVLMRLDPKTLRPAVHSRLDPVLQPGVLVAAGGRSSIWLRDGGDGNQLRCLDARTGRQRQVWSISDGPVSSSRGAALVATTDGAIPLVLSGCAG